jgi:hypothetical protein
MWLPEKLIYQIESLFSIENDLILIVLGLNIMIGLFFGIYYFTKKSYKPLILTTVGLLFPLSTYLAREYLLDWPAAWVIIALTGEYLFVLIISVLIHKWKDNKKATLLGAYGLLFSLVHIAGPWLAMPVFGGSAHQSPFVFSLRYYTVPVLGVSLIVASMFMIVRKNIILRSVFTMTFVITLIFNLINIQNYFNERSNYLDSLRNNLLWQEVKPHFSNYIPSSGIIVTYIDGEVTPKEVYFFKYILPIKLRLEVNPYFRDAKYLTVTDREEVASMLGDGNIFLKYKLPVSPINKNDIFFFRIEEKDVYDIRHEFIKYER